MGRHPVSSPQGNFLVARWRWILLVMLAVVSAATALSYSRTAMYQASADVLVQPRLFAAATAPQVPDMGSERAVARSTAVLEIAADALAVPVSTLGDGLSVSVPLNTHLLHITYTSSEPAFAQQRAQAIAAAYVRYWISAQPPLTSAPGGQRVLESAVISPAKRPTSPTSPQHNVDIAIAVLIGLALGIGTAYLRDRLDDRLRGAPDLEQCGGVPVVALVPPAGLLAGRRSPVLREPHSHGATAYSDLASHLVQAADRISARSVLVTSPVGSAQSAASANLAAALAEAGKQVVLVRADLRRPAGPDIFGLDSERSLAAVVDGRIALADALQDTFVPGLRALPAGRLAGNVAAALHSTQLRQAMRRLRSSADIVIIDGPPVLAGADLGNFTEFADLVLLIGDGRRTTRAQVRAAAQRLGSVRGKLVGSVLENFRGRFHLTDFAFPRASREGPGAHRLDGRSASAHKPDADEAADVLEHANGWTDPALNGKR